MAFNFDSDDNDSNYQVTLWTKAINEPAGLWIAHDIQEQIEWDESRLLEPGIAHSVKTQEVVNDDGDKKHIPGVLIKKPRLLIVGRSPLLAETNTTPSKLLGVWDNNRDKREGNKAVRIYKVIFLDADNNPYHLTPLQLKVRGNFSISFEQALVIGGKNLTGQKIPYRKACELLYAQITGVRPVAKNEKWHSCWVFQPTFKSEMRGQTGAQSSACICYGYVAPTVETFEQFCLGKTDFAQEIADIYDSQIDFWKVKTAEYQKPKQQTESVDNEENNHNQIVKEFRLKIGITSNQILTYLANVWDEKTPAELKVREVNVILRDLLIMKLGAMGLTDDEIAAMQLDGWLDDNHIETESYLGIFESVVKESNNSAQLDDIVF